MKHFFVAVFLGISIGWGASVARAVNISPTFPVPNAYPTSSPGGFVANFYQFALMISGVLAFGAVVYGGVKYISSAGNPSAQTDGKDWIEAALLGLLLLAGAYLVLNVINPDLTNLNALTQIQLQAVGQKTP
jgi:hypothetical protein